VLADDAGLSKTILEINDLRRFDWLPIQIWGITYIVTLPQKSPLDPLAQFH
jgi:hypothetical protein